jgi:hypothetical protein
MITRVSAREIREKIENFFGVTDYMKAGKSCPLCGSSIDWSQFDATSLNIHIDWHERLGFWEIST